MQTQVAAMSGGKQGGTWTEGASTEEEVNTNAKKYLMEGDFVKNLSEKFEELSEA